MVCSFMIRSSSPSSLTSVPDHLPRYPVAGLESGFDNIAGFVAAARAPRNHLALRRLSPGVSGMMMPPPLIFPRLDASPEPRGRAGDELGTWPETLLAGDGKGGKD